MIRFITAAILVLAAGAQVPVAGAKPEYSATCKTTHDLTLTWTGGTDVTATTAVLEWADLSDERVSLTLPKQGGVRTQTWTNLGSNSGPLVGVEVTFRRNNLSSETLRVSCSP